MNYKLNATKTAAVSLNAVWQKIDANTPQGVSVWLISKSAGVSQKGKHNPSNKFFTHWFPNPCFDKDEDEEA